MRVKGIARKYPEAREHPEEAGSSPEAFEDAQSVYEKVPPPQYGGGTFYESRILKTAIQSAAASLQMSGAPETASILSPRRTSRVGACIMRYFRARSRCSLTSSTV